MRALPAPYSAMTGDGSLSPNSGSQNNAPMLDSAGKRKERSPGRIAELTEEDAAARAERRGPPPRTSNSTLPFRAPASSSADDIAALKTEIASQQQQINELQAWKQSLGAVLTQFQSLLQHMVQMPQQMADVSTQLQRLLSQQPPSTSCPPEPTVEAEAPKNAAQQAKAQPKPATQPTSAPAPSQTKAWGRPRAAPSASPEPQRSRPAATNKAAGGAAAKNPAERPVRARGDQLAADLHFRKSFVLHVERDQNMEDSCPPELLVMKDPKEQVYQMIACYGMLLCGRHAIVDAVRMRDTAGARGSPRMRIWFTVNSMEAAARVVLNRCDMKGECFTVYDVLSPEERQQHARLWPQFLAARAAGKKAQFNRARLYVDRAEVLAPPGSVGA